MLFIAILPVVAIGIDNFILRVVLILAMGFFPPISIVFWIWGFVVTIGGVQDWFAIVYYIATVVVFIPSIISMFKK